MTRPGDSPPKLFQKTLLPVVVIVLIALLGLSLLRRASHDGPSFTDTPHQHVVLEEGAVVPDFSIQEIGGPKRKFSELQGKVTFINFWATWCTPCVAEIPAILKMRQHFINHGLNVLLINVDENPDQVVPQMLATWGIGFPTYRDVREEISELFDISGIPVSLFVDQNRTILHVEQGDANWTSDEVTKKIEQWLSK